MTGRTHTDFLTREKRKADTMRRLCGGEDKSYWLGYRLGLLGRKPEPEHQAMLAGIGSRDRTLEARARGYRDGLDYRRELGEEAR